MLNVDIFFGFALAQGDPGLAEALRRHALQSAGRSPLFLRLMAQDVERAGSVLGPFGRWRSKQGRVDLKRGGLWPIVAFARTLALRCGVGATGTLDRLAETVAAGRLAAEEADRLGAAFTLILDEMLDQQLVELAAGRPVGSTVELARLSRDRRARLKTALGHLGAIPVLLRDALTA
jgi:signal-transduction protein with cAMP-binding, CBS, and nucleotidyltransferase domain